MGIYFVTILCAGIATFASGFITKNTNINVLGVSMIGIGTMLLMLTNYL